MAKKRNTKIIARRASAPRRIYLDYAAATPVDPEVFSAMKPHFLSVFGNASSLHAEGASAKKALEAARADVAHSLGAREDEIIFTSGGTESNSLAILGAARALEKKGRKLSAPHFITSAIEHPSVLDCFASLSARGARVSHAPVDEDGLIDPKQIGALVTEKTVLVSIGYGNSEIGTIQPIAAIAKEIRAAARALDVPKPLFHTDASQALLFFPCAAEKLGADLMTFDGQKIYGPKGVGVLYRRRDVSLERLFEGGEQEFSLRPGTENIPLIVGLAKALTLLSRPGKREREGKRLEALREYAVRRIFEKIPDAKLNGHPLERLPNNINISLPGAEGEFLVLALDARGIAAGTGSACLSFKDDASYVVAALPRKENAAAGTLRLSLGRGTTRRDITAAVDAIADILRIQRKY